MILRACAALVLIGLLAGCESQRGQVPEDLPTYASFEALETSQPLTQNAPPPPFNETVTQFAQIDSGLNRLAGGRYSVQLSFDGTFAGESGSASANASAEVLFDQVSSARRVNVTTSGGLIGEASNAYEAVRLGEDTFLVRDGACVASGGDSAAAGADLSAGALIGGVTAAVPAGRQAVINGETVFAYTFTPDALNLPSVRPASDGSLTIDSYELWIAPAQGAVIRYYVNLSVENALIFDRPTPVTGTVIIRYDANDLDIANNITVPFGC
jgi:hypothetical protein